MNIDKLNSMIEADALTAEALEARQWAIVLNAVRELTKAVGYTGPLRDNDMRVAMAIRAAAQRLRDTFEGAVEHNELVPNDPRGTDPVIDKVYNMLDKDIASEIAPRVSEAPVSRHPLPPKGHK